LGFVKANGQSGPTAGRHGAALVSARHDGAVEYDAIATLATAHADERGSPLRPHGR
jgi:hypothetical protein